MTEDSTTEKKPITPEHLTALVTLAITSGDDDTASKSLAALINAVASIDDKGARKNFAIEVIERAYKYTAEYGEGVMALAQLDGSGNGTIH
jgi:hypothetical protein